MEFPELRLKYTEKGNKFIFDIDSIKKNETQRSRRDFFSFIWTIQATSKHAICEKTQMEYDR